MKKLLTLVAILILGSALAFLLMSCAPPPQNANVGSNTNANSANTEDKVIECSEKGITDEMNAIIQASGLENQKTGNGNQYNTVNIKFKPVKIGEYWILLIEGGISDGLKNKPGSNSEYMEIFIKNVDQIITKTCVTRAIFVNRDTIKGVENGSIALGDIQGFDWSTCDWPNVPCPNGQCAEKCPGKTGPGRPPLPNSNANANTPQNVNGNANANRAP